MNAFPNLKVKKLDWQKNEMKIHGEERTEKRAQRNKLEIYIMTLSLKFQMNEFISSLLKVSMDSMETGLF